MRYTIMEVGSGSHLGSLEITDDDLKPHPTGRFLRLLAVDGGAALIVGIPHTDNGNRPSRCVWTNPNDRKRITRWSRFSIAPYLKDADFNREIKALQNATGVK